ncbi:MAG: cytochrome P450 [Pseudomonadota bacterium]
MAANVTQFDLAQLPGEFFADPYPTYARLQQDTPILALPDGSYFLTRHGDLQQIYRDSRRFSSDKRLQFAPVFGTTSALFEHHTTSLVFNDPPLHTRVRKAIGNALSHRVVHSLEQDLQHLVQRLLDQLNHASADVIGDFAAAIPVEIVANLLAIPADDRAPLRRWSLGILGALEVGLDAAALDHGNRCVSEFLDYLTQLVAHRRRHLRATDEDIVARLLRWRDAQAGLLPAQLLHQCIFLLNAGHETTTNLIGNGIELLLRHPEQLQRLLAEPELIDLAVEEILRVESPNQLGNRTTTSAVTLHDCELPAGTVLTLCIGAANRDPRVFTEPDHFDIRRDPNPHLAFAAGIHTCAGLHVARLEARVALQMFFQRFPKAELAGVPRRAPRARFRGFSALRVRLA